MPPVSPPNRRSIAEDHRKASDAGTGGHGPNVSLSVNTNPEVSRAFPARMPWRAPPLFRGDSEAFDVQRARAAPAPTRSKMA